MIQRLPAIGISAFSAIIVAAPIAMLLNAAVTARADDAAESHNIQQLVAPAETAFLPEVKAAPRPTDDGGEPVVEERPIEKTE